MVALSRIQRGAAIERRQREDRRAETRVYGCDLCGGWHVSSQRPRRA